MSAPVHESPPSRLRVGGVLVLLIFIWGSTWAAIRVSLEGFPPFTGASLRFGLAAVVLFALALLRGIPLGRTRRERTQWLVQGLFMFTLPYAVVYWAEQWIPSGLMAVLYSTYPLIVLILGRFLLPGAERLGRLALLGLGFGFGGVAVIFSSDLTALGGPKVALASAVALLAPCFGAVGHLSAKRWGEGIHGFSMTAVPMMIAASLLGGLAFAVERDAVLELTPGPVLAVLYLALFGSVVTFNLFFWAVRHMSVTQLSLITYVIPVVAVLIGTLVFDEPMTPRILAGAALVIAGVALVVRPARGEAA